jgi:hypothetical protein
MDLPDRKDPDFSFGSQGRFVVCYRLARGNSATQPFVLEPVSPDDLPSSGFARPCGDKQDPDSLAGGDREGKRVCRSQLARVRRDTPDNPYPLDPHHWTPCSELQKDPPALKANQILVVGVDISDIGQIGPDTKLELTGPNQNQLKLFNINVTAQQGSALNPAPVRASFPSTAGAGGGSGAAPPLGLSKIVDSNGFGSPWVYIGTHAPNGATRTGDHVPAPWMPDNPYAAGDIVSDATGRDFYRLDFQKPAADDSCSNRKDRYCSGTRPVDPFPPEQTADWVVDGQVVWQEGSGQPPNLISSATVWQPNSKYAQGQIVCVLREDKDAVEDIKHDLVRAEKNKPNLIDTLNATQKQILDLLKKQPQSSSPLSCEGAQKLHNDVLPGQRNHPHYYFAVRGGQSGTPPPDPFSIQYLTRVIYLPWPYLLPGDAIPTFNVNLVYTPPTPGAPWQGNTFYPAGSVVIPGTSNGHYYTALTGGFSDLEPREPNFVAADPQKNQVPDGSLWWLDSGASAPTVPANPGAGNSQGGGGGGGGQGAAQAGGQGSAGKRQIWMPYTHFLLGDVILRPESGHYFVVAKIDSGISGSLPASGSAKDPFPAPPSPVASLLDGEVIWTIAPPDPSGICAGCRSWVPLAPYNVDVDKVSFAGLPYIMTGSTRVSGSTGTTSPFNTSSPAPQVTDHELSWRLDPQATSNAAWQKSDPPSTTTTTTTAPPPTITTYSVGQAICDDPRQLAVDSTGRKTCHSGQTYIVDHILVGTSGPSDPTSQSIPHPPLTASDGDLLWTAVIGTPPPGRLKAWAPQSPFNIGDIVHADKGGYFQVARFLGGLSGSALPDFPITRYCTVIDPRIKIDDGEVKWQYMGSLRPRQASPGCSEEPPNSSKEKAFITWPQLHTVGVPNYTPGYVPPGTVIFEPREEGGRYYEATKPGSTGAVSPFTNITPPMVITWLDSGTTPPSSVASGQPSDQTVSLITLPLPQTHTLARFNLAAGVEMTFHRPNSFGWVAPTAPGVHLPVSTGGANPTYYVPASQIETTGSAAGAVPAPIPTTVPTTGAGATPVAVEPTSQCTYGTTQLTDTAVTPSKPVYPVYECPLKTGAGTWPADGVLVLTAYLLPVDAEVKWRWKFYAPTAWRDWVPAPSLGMSLTNPTTNFYVGASNEFGVRNLQVFYGYSSLNLPSKLVSPGSQQVWGGQGTAPAVATTSAFQHGVFLGATFNLSNFVSGLIGGAAK